MNRVSVWVGRGCHWLMIRRLAYISLTCILALWMCCRLVGQHHAKPERGRYRRVKSHVDSTKNDESACDNPIDVTVRIRQLGKASVILSLIPLLIIVFYFHSLTHISISLEILNLTIQPPCISLSNSITTIYRQYVDSSKVRRSIIHCHFLRHCTLGRCPFLHLLPALQPAPRTMHLASLRALDAAFPFLALPSVALHDIVADDNGHGPANTGEFCRLLSVGGTGA